MTYELLQNHKESVRRLKNVFLQYYKIAQVHHFIEKKEPEIEKFFFPFFPSLPPSLPFLSFRRTKLKYQGRNKQFGFWCRFVGIFSKKELLDEKATLLLEFLASTSTKLSTDPLWKNSSTEEKKEASVLLEKDFMCRIYTK